MYKSRYFAGFLLLILCAGTATAQNPKSFYVEEPRTFYGGLIMGANFTQVDGDNFAGYHKIGLNAGGIMYAHLGNKVAASMEILFSQKGSRSNLAQASNSRMYQIHDYRIDLNYAEIPIQINYFDRRRSHFGGGFSFSQLINYREAIRATPEITQDTLDLYGFRKSDLNFILGGNLHLWQGLFLNVRFQYSVLSVRKQFHPEFGRADQYNNMWVLRLMYLF